MEKKEKETKRIGQLKKRLNSITKILLEYSAAARERKRESHKKEKELRKSLLSAGTIISTIK